MKYFIFILLFSTFLSLTNANQPCNENEHPNILGLSTSLSNLSLRNNSKIDHLCDPNAPKQRVQECLNKGDIEELYAVFKEFSNEEPKMDIFYEQACTSCNITKWPSQTTFREAWLGDIFYPRKEIRLYYEHWSSEYLIKRFDILWSLAMSAKFNNPLALYYLTRGLQIHIDAIADCDTEVIPNLYKKALGILEKVKDNDDAYWVRATAYELAYRGTYCFNPHQAFELHAQSKEKESQLQMLLIRERYINFVKPTQEDYINLSQAYPKGYIEIVEKFAEGFDEKVSLLNLAYENGYYPALLELGWLYGKAGNKEKALQYHHTYSERYQSPAGYYYASMLYVPGSVDYPVYYQNRSDEDILGAIQELQKASHFSPHQEALKRLGILSVELYKRSQNPEWENTALESFHKAAFLGAMDAYDYIDSTKDSFSHLNGTINKILYLIGYSS